MDQFILRSVLVGVREGPVTWCSIEENGREL